MFYASPPHHHTALFLSHIITVILSSPRDVINLFCLYASLTIIPDSVVAFYSIYIWVLYLLTLPAFSSGLLHFVFGCLLLTLSFKLSKWKFNSKTHILKFLILLSPSLLRLLLCLFLVLFCETWYPYAAQAGLRLCCPNWPWTHPPALVFHLPGLQVCKNMSGKLKH